MDHWVCSCCTWCSGCFVSGRQRLAPLCLEPRCVQPASLAPDPGCLLPHHVLETVEKNCPPGSVFPCLLSLNLSSTSEELGLRKVEKLILLINRSPRMQIQVCLALNSSSALAQDTKTKEAPGCRCEGPGMQGHKCPLKGPACPPPYPNYAPGTLLGPVGAIAWTEGLSLCGPLAGPGCLQHRSWGSASVAQGPCFPWEPASFLGNDRNGLPRLWSYPDGFVNLAPAESQS